MSASALHTAKEDKEYEIRRFGLSQRRHIHCELGEISAMNRAERVR